MLWWYNILDLFLSPWIRTRIPNPDPKHCQTISLPCSQHVPCHRMLTKSHSIGTGTLERGSSLHRTFSEGTDRSYSLRVLDEKLYNQLVEWRCDNKNKYKWSTAGYISQLILCQYRYRYLYYLLTRTISRRALFCWTCTPTPPPPNDIILQKH